MTVPRCLWRRRDAAPLATEAAPLTTFRDEARKWLPEVYRTSPAVQPTTLRAQGFAISHQVVADIRARQSSLRRTFMKIPTLTAIALILNFTACANNASTGYNSINNDPVTAAVTAAAVKCHKTADAVDDTPFGEEHLAYFKKCMKQYGYNTSAHPDVSSTVSAPPAQGLGKVQIEKRGSSYYVPVRINDTITIPFLLDAGAGDLAIPEDVAQTLIRAGALKSGDFIGKRLYQIANGSEEVSPLVRMREVRVGDHVVRNVTAGITRPTASRSSARAFYRNSVLSPSTTNGSSSSSPLEGHSPEPPSPPRAGL